MNASSSIDACPIGRVRRSWLAALAGAAPLLLAACNGTAVVTMTSTPSTDAFLAYRVGLVSVQLQSSAGKSGLSVLPAGTTVDFASLTDVSEVLGAAAVAKASYTGAVIVLDYSSAQIVYDNGTLDGIALTPVDSGGKALGQVQLTLSLDPGDSFDVSSGKASRLALDFKLAASNAVNLASNTVTVTPLIAASAAPIDAKSVRIRGPLLSVDATTGQFTIGVVPFDGTAAGAGKLAVYPSSVTTYEINGAESIGTAGSTSLAGLGTNTLVVAYGTLTAVDQTTTDTTTTVTDGTTSTTTTSTDLTFSAAQVLAGASVQGFGFDRVSGAVSARSGNTLTLEDATLVAADGSVTFVGGTTIVSMGPNTAVSVFGQNTVEINSPQQISVGSMIAAFGTAGSVVSGDLALDASAGRVRLGTSTASGLVTAQGSGILTLGLASLDGRSVAAFDFAGTGATAGAYSVSTGELDLTNSTTGTPVTVTGMPNSFGASSPNFTASTLLDSTTIDAQLVVDWGAGTPAPFTTYDSSAIDVDAHNASIGTRHQIRIGAQTIDIVGLSSDPLIVPNATASTAVFAIGHSASGTVENFDTYAAFITQLQAELNGSVPATGMTALGQYTASTFTFTATSITLFLNN